MAGDAGALHNPKSMKPPLRLDLPHNSKVQTTLRCGAVERTVGIDADSADRLSAVGAFGEVIERGIRPAIRCIAQLEDAALLIRTCNVCRAVQVAPSVHGEL